MSEVIPEPREIPEPLEVQESTALVYEQNLPLRWWQLPCLPEENELHRLNDAALRIVQVALAWEPTPQAPEGHEEPGGRASELVEFKVNLLLELVSELLTRDQPLPIPAAVELTGEGIWWKTARPPGESEILRVELYILPSIPKPLVLIGEVTSIERSDDLYRVHARFLDMPEQLHEAMQKMIFRHHRRLVAEARRTPLMNP